MSELVIMGCKCKSAFCPDCGVPYWAKVRSKAMKIKHMFKKPALLTLTIDRSNYDTGEQAYDCVKEERYIPRFLNSLGFDKAFSILAFHKSTEKEPDGCNWPHWHILVDLADCGGWINLEKGWKLWRDKWGIGGFDLPTHTRYPSAQRAVNYILSYMQHQSGVVAQWLLDRRHSPRCYEFYGECRKVLRGEPKTEHEIDFDLPENEHEDLSKLLSEENEVPDFYEDILSDMQSSSVKQRIDNCYTSSIVLEKKDNGCYSFVGTLDIAPGALAILSKSGRCHDIKRDYQDSEHHEGWFLKIGYLCNDVDEGMKELQREVVALNRLKGGYD